MTEAITEAICAVMAEVGAVEKRGRNEFHRYDYATAADIAHKLQPLMAQHGLVIFQTETARHELAGGSAMAVEYEFALAHKSGSVWPDRPRFTGVAAAKNTKGGFDDKCINKCHTAARKYFLLGLFQIPTGDFDDADAQEDRPAAKPQAANAKREIPKPPSKEERADGERAKGIADALKAADSLAMLSDIWSHADIDGLPDKFTQRLRAIYYERLDALSPDTDETEGDEPHEAKLMRAG